jgi:S1-C subfamily serine protease
MKRRECVVKSIYQFGCVAFCLGLTGLTLCSCEALDEFATENKRRHELRLLGTPEVLDQEQAATAVVRIFGAKEHDINSTGSGIYLEKISGIIYILTAYHVVEEAEITVEFLGFPNRRFQAKLLKADEDLDLAVITTVDYVPTHITETLIPFQTGRAEDSGELANNSLPVLLFRNLTPLIAQEFQLVQLEGALISYVLPGSNAHAVGLRRGDLVIIADGSPIRDSAGLVAHIKAMSEGETVELTWLRQEERIRARILLGKRGTNEPVYTIGHPAGKDWSWQAGWIVGLDTSESLSITGDLVSGGVSGGPLFDKKFRVIGIVTAKETQGTAVRIERALEFVEALRVPYKFWLTETFCERLREVMTHSDNDYEEIKVGAGRRSMRLPQHYKWEWDASIDLSGRGRGKIVVDSYGETEYQAEMVSDLGVGEDEIVLREIARSIMKCHPDSYVHRIEKGFRIDYYGGGEPNLTRFSYPIYVYNFAHVIEIHIN